MLSQVAHGSEILSKGPISHSLGVVPKAGGVASVRYVAAAEPDQPDNHRKRDREQRNDWSAFTEIVEKIENGEQGDQYGQERRRTIDNDAPWVRRQAIFACVSSSYSLEISWPV